MERMKRYRPTARRRTERREKNQSKAEVIDARDTPILPCDIIYRILSQLSVKSLLRFSCVCKSWRLLISQPKFIKTHLNQSIKLDRQRLLCWAAKSDCFYSIDYEISSNNNSYEKLNLPHKPWRPIIYSSCNGFVLLGLDNEKTLVLWNPSTRAYKKLSCPFYFYFSHVELCGLCYDSSMDDYKVVLITRACPDHHETLYVVFSFKGKSWTEARKFPYNSTLHSVNVKGVLYIKVVKPAIVLFDALNDKFKEVPLPPPNCERMRFSSLMVVEGWLGLYYCSPRGGEGYVWVMKEDGDMNSWTELIIVPPSLGGKLLCVTEKGELVMVIDGQNIGVYNPKENKYREVATIPQLGRGDKSLDIVVSFVDSLVLPPVD